MTASYPDKIKTFTVKVDGVDTIYAVDINSLQEEIVAIETDLISELKTGWTPLLVTCTYLSTISFTVPGNLTTMFPTGTKLHLAQSGVTKYFYIVSSSYSSVTGMTTVTITGGSDYSLTNTTISSPKISYATTPQGFPGWFNWAPTLTGFSVVPGSSVYQFKVDSRQVFFNISQGTDGTSNLTTFTISLPITAAAYNTWQGANGFAVNNGAALTGASRWYIAGGGTTIELYTNMANGAWTASGGKRARLQGFYQIP